MFFQQDQTFAGPSEPLGSNIRRLVREFFQVDRLLRVSYLLPGFFPELKSLFSGYAFEFEAAVGNGVVKELPFVLVYEIKARRAVRSRWKLVSSMSNIQVLSNEHQLGNLLLGVGPLGYRLDFPWSCAIVTVTARLLALPDASVH